MRYATLALTAVLLAPAVVPAEPLHVLVDGKPLTPAVDTAKPLRSAAELAPGEERTAPFEIGGQQAVSVATEAIRARGEPERLVASNPAARYYKRRVDGVLTSVWSVDVATANPWGVWRVFVSGQTGQVVRVTEMALHARGLVFPTGKAVDENRPAMRPLPELGKAKSLNGPHVMVYDTTDALGLCPTTELFCVPSLVQTCAARPHNGVFSYSPNNHDTFGSCTVQDRFDQVTAYYQLARMAEYFTNQVGWRPGLNLLAGYMPLAALANVPLYANAFFSPPSDSWPPYLAFGDEFDPPQYLDFTSDPSVPRHEFTHAMIYDSGSALNDIFACVDECPFYAGAMHEACADYFAVSSLGGHDTVVGGRLGEALADAARDLENDFRFPCDLTQEVHADGRIWGSFLFELRRFLGKGLDPIVFRSLQDLPHRSDLQFAHALDALVQRLAGLSSKAQTRLVETAVRKGLVGPWAYQRPDGNLQIDSGDVAWNCGGGNVCGVTPPEDAREGDGAASISIDASFTTGLAAFATRDEAIDLRGQNFVSAWVRSDVDVTAGALSLVLDDSPDCSSPVRVLPVPALSAGLWRQAFLGLADGEDLQAITCVGLRVVSDRDALVVSVDDVEGTVPFQFGPAVVALHPGSHLTLRNRFPAPFADAHFYYFTPPAGATTVRVRASASGATKLPTDLVYCGAVSVSGNEGATVPPELNNVFLWVYDPAQFSVPAALAPLPLDQHQLVTGVPAAGATSRRLRAFPLPASPTGIYAISVQGSGGYRVNLKFE